MANFWRSFQQGWSQGDQIYDRNQKLARRKKFQEISEETPVETQSYSPEQLAQLRDPAEAQGGVWDEQAQAFRMPDGSIQNPTNTPTWDASAGAYKAGDGSHVSPSKSYSLGGRTQSTPFSDADINAHRTNRMADVYAATGDPEKGMGLRAQSQAVQLGQFQMDELMRKKQFEEKFQGHMTKVMDINNKMSALTAEADELYKKGDIVGATTLLAKARTDLIPDNRKVFVDSADGMIYGIDGEKLNKSGMNAYNPQTYEKLRQSIGKSLNEWEAANRPVYDSKDFREMQKEIRAFANDERRIAQGDRQLDITEQTARNREEGEDRRLEKTISANAEQTRVKEEGDWRRTQYLGQKQLQAAGISKKAYERVSYIGPDPKTGIPIYESSQSGLFMSDGKGGRAPVTDSRGLQKIGTEKPATFKDRNEALLYAQGMYGEEWDRMPPSKREEIMGELTGQSSGGGVSLLDAAASLETPQGSTGLQNRPAPVVPRTLRDRLSGLTVDELRRTQNLSPEDQDFVNRLIKARTAADRFSTARDIGR